jgi:GTP-binding GTPase Middle Region
MRSDRRYHGDLSSSCAHSREAKLQVEIARLKYVSPRLRESAAGGGRQQGSGAGDSDLDLDRRKIRDCIAELKEQLEDFGTSPFYGQHLAGGAWGAVRGCTRGFAKDSLGPTGIKVSRPARARIFSARHLYRCASLRMPLRPPEIGLAQWRPANSSRRPSSPGEQRRDRARNARGRSLGSTPLPTGSAHETG